MLFFFLILYIWRDPRKGRKHEGHNFVVECFKEMENLMKIFKKFSWRWSLLLFNFAAVFHYDCSIKEESKNLIECKENPTEQIYIYTNIRIVWMVQWQYEVRNFIRNLIYLYVLSTHLFSQPISFFFVQSIDVDFLLIYFLQTLFY